MSDEKVVLEKDGVRVLEGGQWEFWGQNLGMWLPSNPGAEPLMDVLARALAESEAKRVAEGRRWRADSRAIHDALGWAHEQHGADLPAPSKDVCVLLGRLARLEDFATGFAQDVDAADGEAPPSVPMFALRHWAREAKKALGEP